MSVYSHIIEKSKKYQLRPCWPKRIVITGGMPNGNKKLHVGHLAAVFVWADVFARFMRCNIGEENVIFVSGTDGYGSPTEERYRIAVESGQYNGTIDEFVRLNHDDQMRTLCRYGIGLNLFAASCLSPYKEFHELIGEKIFTKLYNKRCIVKQESLQFFDIVHNKFLNGRQVVGKCPIVGCCSEYGYADECALGHQYQPSELIDPISTISNSKPELRKAENWYLPLEQFKSELKAWVAHCETQETSRDFMLTIINDFLRKPVLFVRKLYLENIASIKMQLPPYELISPEKGELYQLEFESIADRDIARELFTAHNIRCRTSNTLVPLRLTGDVNWGLKVPALAVTAGSNIKSFWVWPESLWAPISFTQYYLSSKSRNDSWKDWWCSDDCEVWQFIGEDNIYFYAVVEPAMFSAYNSATSNDCDKIRLPKIVANKHVLIGNSKASSSGKFRAPTAEELLDNYTVEQLKMHFLAQGLETNQFQFKSKIYTDPDFPGKDPVVAQGDLLYNIFNRLARSILYTVQKNLNNEVPVGNISEEVLEESFEAILDYEQSMYSAEMHKIITVLDVYLRNANKRWAKVMNFSNGNIISIAEQKQAVIDALHVVRTAMTLVYPISQPGPKMMQEYFGFKDEIWDWKLIFKSAYELMENPSNPKFKFLEPRVDFFKRI